ncbi:unnamed protein product [Didymodactylos carnosus]|uniref:Bromodomain associated domain-containing protein n=1 Tax=Didymodactylos carnosus TaxID=1234261 RepID=A0A8S2SVB9_9BILA|nr:unnamed protein product [Didymodactylos carnosus]
MSQSYAREVLKVAISQICDTIGFSSISSTALDILVDVAERQTKCYAKETHDLIETDNRIEYPNAIMEDLLPVFLNFNETVDDIQDYMIQFESLSYNHDILKFPAKSKLTLKIPGKNCPEILERNNNEQTEYIYDWLPLFPDQEIPEQQTIKETIEDDINITDAVITRKTTKFNFDSHLSSLKSSHYRPTNVTLASDGTIVNLKSADENIRSTSRLPKLLYRPQRLIELDKKRQKEEEDKQEKERQSQQDENDRRLLLTITSSSMSSSEQHESLPIATLKLPSGIHKSKKDLKKNGQTTSTTLVNDRSLHVKDVNRKSLLTLQQNKSYNTQSTSVDEAIDSVIRSINQQKISQLSGTTLYDFDTNDASSTDLSKKSVPLGKVPSLLINLKTKSTSEQSHESSKSSVHPTLISPSIGKHQSPVISPLIITNSSEVKEKQLSSPIIQQKTESLTTSTISEQLTSPPSIVYDLSIKPIIADVPHQQTLETTIFQPTITEVYTSLSSFQLPITKEKKKKRHREKKDRSKKEHKQQNDIQQPSQIVSPSTIAQLPTNIPLVPPTSGGMLRVKIKIGKNENISIIKSTLPEVIENKSFEDEEPGEIRQLNTSQSNVSVSLNESTDESLILPTLTVDVATHEQSVDINDSLEQTKREPLICKIISPNLKTSKFINKTFSPEIIAGQSKQEQRITTVEHNIEKRTSPMPILEPPIVSSISTSNSRKTKTPNRAGRKRGLPKSIAIIEENTDLTNTYGKFPISSTMNEQLHVEQPIIRMSLLPTNFRTSLVDSTVGQRSRPSSTDDDDLPLIKRHPHGPRSSQPQSSTSLPTSTTAMLPPASPTIPLHLLSESERTKRKQPAEFIWKPSISQETVQTSQQHATTIRGRGNRGPMMGAKSASEGS